MSEKVIMPDDGSNIGNIVPNWVSLFPPQPEPLTEERVRQIVRDELQKAADERAEAMKKWAEEVNRDYTIRDGVRIHVAPYRVLTLQEFGDIADIQSDQPADIPEK